MIPRLLRLLVAATLAAGVFGLLRQRREARLRRSDPRAAAAASAAEDPPGYGPLARRLAHWVPARPRSPLGRRFAAIWAAPLTAAGWLVAVASGGRPVWDEARGCFLAGEVGGASRVMLRLVGAQANAIGQVVVCTVEDPSAALLAHETVHVRQAERLGPLLFPLYVWLGARYGYRNHPLERAARAGARRTILPGSPGRGQ